MEKKVISEKVSDDPNVSAKQRTSLALERTKHAAERTYLSWMRTAIATIGGGVAIAKFLTFYNPTHTFLAKFVGELLIITGIALFIFAGLRFNETLSHFRSTRTMTRGIVIAYSIIMTIISIILIYITSFGS